MPQLGGMPTAKSSPARYTDGGSDERKHGLHRCFDPGESASLAVQPFVAYATKGCHPSEIFAIA
jgi:hypothetical protein